MNTGDHPTGKPAGRPVFHYRIPPSEKSPTADNLTVKIRPARRPLGGTNFYQQIVDRRRLFSLGEGDSIMERLLWNRRDYLYPRGFFMGKTFYCDTGRAASADAAAHSRIRGGAQFDARRECLVSERMNGGDVVEGREVGRDKERRRAIRCRSDSGIILADERRCGARNYLPLRAPHN